ncbi:class I SAM-dependent methyltransferase [Peptococcaceae bacterium]|nr:class I SAM-dependent methyltransferase [Peptococcaceae bacterium]
MQKKLLKLLFEKLEYGDSAITVEFWDGEEVVYGNAEPRFKIIFRKPLSIGDVDFDDLVMTFGEVYMDEVIDFEGELDELIRIMNLNEENFKTKKGLGSKILSASAKVLNTADVKSRRKENIQHHYDLGDDFFALWLDESMTYSCAYFKSADDSLFDAQMQKVDHTIKKLELKPGNYLLDIGCGWGWLVIRAAQLFDIRALGITLSENQYRMANKRKAELGLSDRVEVKLLDYMDLNKDEYQFDRIVSVGMFEHVGKENIPKYMEKVHELLKPGGVSLLHTIAKQKEGPTNKWIQKYIFPGGYIPTLREIISSLPEYDFHLVHAESLRRHYALTLERWYENFQKHVDKIEEKFGRRFVRMWGLYLRGCAATFRVSGLNIYQLLFTKGINNELSLTLDHIYTTKFPRSKDIKSQLQAV